MTNPTDQTDRAGIHAVGAAFTKLGWVFREQPTSDYGIDAHAEKMNSDGTAGGKLIALQIKTGASYFRKKGENFVFYGEARHRDYWTNHSLPVFLILHNPDTGITLWQRIERHLIIEGKEGNWSIEIPSKQTLDAKNEQFIAAGIASDASSLRRARLALDLPLLSEFASKPSGFIKVPEWVNKTLNFRGADIIFGDDPTAKVGVNVGVLMAGRNIGRFMAVFFPWLDWDYHEYIGEENYSFEVAVHVLKVSLNTIGEAALTLETFYEDGVEEKTVVIRRSPDDDDEMEFWYDPED